MQSSPAVKRTYDTPESCWALSRCTSINLDGAQGFRFGVEGHKMRRVEKLRLLLIFEIRFEDLQDQEHAE